MEQQAERRGTTGTAETEAALRDIKTRQRQIGSPVLAGIMFVICAGIDLVWNPPLLILGPMGLLIWLAFMRFRMAAMIVTLMIIALRLVLAGIWVMTGWAEAGPPDALGFVFLLAPFAPQILFLLGGFELLRSGLFIRDEGSDDREAVTSRGTEAGITQGAHRYMDRAARVVLGFVLAVVIVGGLALLYSAFPR